MLSELFVSNRRGISVDVNGLIAWNNKDYNDIFYCYRLYNVISDDLFNFCKPLIKIIIYFKLETT